MRATRVPASFLPDFCGSRAAFAIVLVAELLAIMLALVAPGSMGERLQSLGLLSLYVQSVALICAAALCLLQTPLQRLTEHWVAAWSYTATLVISACVSEVAWQVGAEWIPPSDVEPDHLSFVARSLGISAIAWALTLRYFYVQHQWRRRVESEADARFQSLQSRIRPHFLFNCMNTIAGLTRRSPQLAEEVTEDLADLFRASLGDVHKPGTLGEELDLCERFLRIESHRLGERLKVDWKLDDIAREARLPALVLQPLIENAIYHGIEPLTGGGTIHITGRVQNGSAVISIANPCPDARSRTAHAGNKLAQDNVAQRLGAFFLRDGLLKIEDGGVEYRVTLTIPLNEDPDR